MNGYTGYRLWWINHQARCEIEVSPELQFEDHINALSSFELFDLMERIEDGTYDGFLAAYQRETDRLKARAALGEEKK